MSKELIRLQNISKHFTGVKALDCVNISISKGEICCLAGGNGSGKSTLVKIISGVHKPEPGAQIKIDGTEYKHLTPHKSLELGIAVIYQDLSLFPNLTVCENIYMGVTMCRDQKIMNWREAEEIARKAMKRVNISLPLRELVGNLSIADQQLVAICRSLTRDVRLLIMDEPTTALTRVEVNSLFEVVRDLQKKDVASLFISHKLDEVFEISEKVTILKDGQLTGHFQPEELDHHKLTYLMTGHTLNEEIPHYDYSEKETPRLEVKNLSKTGNFKDISFKLLPGEIISLTGLLGSGRTELAQALFGLEPAEKGVILSKGNPVNINTVQNALAEKIAYVPEDRLSQGLILEQPIYSNVVLSIIRKMTNLRNLLNIPAMIEETENWVKTLLIKISNSKAAVNTLSGGNQQKVVLAKWLATEPDILILDNPTVGIDVAAKQSIHSTVKNLAESGLSVILISDEIPEVLYNSHRILIMHKGRIAGEFLSEETSEEEIQTYINSLN